ncbi:asparagine synthase [Lentzea sp. NBRC 105346]|nr:asparagine synthase [Lentzea sp. NBRC 105346]
MRRAEGDLGRLMSFPGAYSAVLVDETGEVTLVADAAAQFPLFVSATGQHVVFGSEARAVAGRTAAEPDLVALAAQVVALFVDRTAFSGVHQLEPGSALRMGAHGTTRLTVTSLAADAGKTLGECADELRECLVTAIEARSTTSAALSSDFSGGLDSTSLAFLATRHADPLPVVTFAQADAPVDDDLRHAQRYATLDARLRHHVVTGGPEHLPYRDWLSGADQPHSSRLAMGPTGLQTSTVASLGCDTHFVGEGGDLVLGAPLGYFIDLARRGELTTLWRHCTAWGRLRHRSPLSLFTRSVRLASTSRRRSLLMLARQLGHGAFARSWEEHNITPWGGPMCDWLAPPAREALAEHLVVLAGEADDGMDAGDRATMSQLKSAGGTQQAVRETGARHGVTVHAPFLDARVVRTCLSLAAWRRCDPAGPKPLLRKALSGLVPEVVLSRRTKGDYTGAAHLGVRRNMPALRKLMENPVSAELGLIEPRRVREALTLAARGIETPWASLNQVLAIELWLREVMGRA